jgi:hypothetical protein
MWWLMYTEGLTVLSVNDCTYQLSHSQLQQYKFYRRCNSEFVNRVRSGMITVIWPCKRRDRTRILRRALDLKFKGNRLMGWSRTRWFGQVLGDVRKRGKSWQEIEKERLWEEVRDWRLLVHQPIWNESSASRGRKNNLYCSLWDWLFMYIFNFTKLYVQASKQHNMYGLDSGNSWKFSVTSFHAAGVDGFIKYHNLIMYRHLLNSNFRIKS